MRAPGARRPTLDDWVALAQLSPDQVARQQLLGPAGRGQRRPALLETEPFRDMLRLYGLLNAHQRERATGSGLARDEMSPDQQKAFDSLASSGVLEPTLSGAPAPLGRAAHRMRFEPLEDVCKRVTFEITSRGVANAVGVFRIGARTSR